MNESLYFYLQNMKCIGWLCSFNSIPFSIHLAIIEARDVFSRHLADVVAGLVSALFLFFLHYMCIFSTFLLPLATVVATNFCCCGRFSFYSIKREN